MLSTIDVSNFHKADPFRDRDNCGLIVHTAERVQKYGVAVVRGLLSQSQMQPLYRSLEDCLREDFDKHGPGYRFHGMVHALMTRGSVFLDLLTNQDLRTISQKILGHGCIVHAFNSSSMPPQGTNYSRAIHVDCPRWISGYITNIGWLFPLTRFTKDNGAMEIMPLSFNSPEAPTEEAFEQEKIILDDLEPGDAVCFNARCWHRGGVNTTNQWRHSITLNVTRAYIRQQFDYPRMMGVGFSDLKEDLQQFLGGCVRMPVSMAEFLLPADQRPYRPGQE